MRVQTGDTEQIVFLVLQKNGTPAVGRATLRLRIYRKSDNQFLDWADMTFKAAGWTTLDQTMTEVSAANAPGHYELVGGFDTSAIISASPNDTYVTVPSQTSGIDVLPGPGEMVVGFWADDIAKIDEVATTVPASAATGSLIDRLANKDAGKNYNPALHSLQAIREREG